MVAPNLTLDERLAELLDAWRRDVRGTSLPELVDLAVAVAIVRAGPTGRVCPPTTYPPGTAGHCRGGRKLSVHNGDP
jgi:hypothetical protein